MKAGGLQKVLIKVMKVKRACLQSGSRQQNPGRQRQVAGSSRPTSPNLEQVRGERPLGVRSRCLPGPHLTKIPSLRGPTALSTGHQKAIDYEGPKSGL